jgi:hypothetical protein
MLIKWGVIIENVKVELLVSTKVSDKILAKCKNDKERHKVIDWYVRNDFLDKVSLSYINPYLK